jgi:ferritin-like metal-binding protein YciE
MAEDIKSLMAEKLNQTYTTEKLILESLPKMAAAVSSPTLKQAFEAHRRETEQQVARLEQAGQQMGLQIKGAPCEAMEGLAAEAERLISEHQRGPLLDVALVAAAQAVEHHEIAVYGTMRTLARSAGMDQVAELLEQTLQEEKATDEKLTMVAEREVNPAALKMAA